MMEAGQRLPEVSVIIPSYNYGDFLSDAIESLIAQSYTNWRAIVIDDGSTDNTEQVVMSYVMRDPRVTYARKPNGGLSSGRNAGLKLAQGKYVCLLDADDVYLPHKLERQVEFLEGHEAVDLVYGEYFLGDMSLNRLYISNNPPPSGGMSFREALVYRNWFDCNTPMFRKTLVDTVGCFNESLSASEDWDYWIRCAYQGRFAYLPGGVAVYRTHSQQMHNNVERMWSNGLRVLQSRFPKGTREYRHAIASICLAHARYAYGSAAYLKTGCLLLSALFYARTPGTLLSIDKIQQAGAYRALLP